MENPPGAAPTGTFPPVNKSSNSGEISDAMGGSTEVGTTDVTWIPPTVQDNAAVAMLVSIATPNVLILSSTDGQKCTQTIIPRSLADNERPRFSFVGLDGTTYVYDDQGIHLGQPTS